jgi:choline dehydrogenase-like flavoprotein
MAPRRAAPGLAAPGLAALCSSLGEVLAAGRPGAGPAGVQGDQAAPPRRVIIIGAGTVGAVLATELAGRTASGVAQVVVLERGPAAFADHVQNLRVPGLQVPRPAQPGGPVTGPDGIWRQPWRSALPFPGLACGVGGRSLYWGAFSPVPTASELAAGPDGTGWPPEVAAALRGDYLQRAARLLGADRLFPHFLGPLAAEITSRVQAAIARGSLPGAIPLAELPSHPAVTAAAGNGHRQPRTGHARGGPPGRPGPGGWDEQALRLVLPMALELAGPAAHPVSYRFSSVPGLTWALRRARDAAGRRPARLALVPGCQVLGLTTSGGAIRAVRTTQGELPVAATDVVVLAAGTIENARLALLPHDPRGAGALVAGPRPGARLASHLRSNLVLRLRRRALGLASQQPLGAAAVLARCRVPGPAGAGPHFHHQLTAFGLGDELTPAATVALLRMSPRPDAEALTGVRTQTADHAVICVTSVAQMSPAPASQVTLGPERDRRGTPRAQVTLEVSGPDEATWDAMDSSADDLALILAGGHGYEVLGPDGFTAVAPGQPPRSVAGLTGRREPLGSSHHELGSLWLSAEPGSSVTDPEGRLWPLANGYAAGPALFPSLGSANPVLPAVALTLRLADHLAGLRAGQAAPRP